MIKPLQVVIRRPVASIREENKLIPEIDEREIPFLTTDQMREVDRAMIEDYGIQLIQMMENAGRNLAALARYRFLNGKPNGRKVTVLAGAGGNGGGGLVCARRLHNWGAEVTVWLSAPSSRFADIPGHQLAILEKMGVSIYTADDGTELPGADLIIDALIGYSLRGAPTGIAATLIRGANEHRAPILSLDTPSGVDTATGTAHEPSINASATLTLALPKEGLRSRPARERVGELYLADISVPPELYASVPPGFDVPPIFAENDMVRVW